MTDTRNTILSAITKACTDLYYPEEVKPETKISELCRDSLDRVEFIMHIEERLSCFDIEIVIDDDTAPGMEGTIGDLVDFIEKGIGRG
jgi:acyl carrier protein